LKQVYLHIILLICTFTNGYGQISPGDLTMAHAAYEGMSNCVLCHDLGDKVSSTKCLDCHKEIQALIKQKRGYHSGTDVKNKDCIECHSEHHGRKFDMTRFDEKKFDHELAKYELEGKHATTECRDCHVAENIQDREIRKRQDTYLGLDQNCLSCHDDFHQKTLSKDCDKCHNIEAFRPAKLFDHDETEFKLKGKHIEVKCVLCHDTIQRAGKKFQVFANVAHKKCNDCHKDPHNDNFINSCAECHVETSFNDFTGRKNFDHNKTNFALKGKHNNVDCFKCHKDSKNPETIFTDRLGVVENDCVKCHKDVHEGKFGTDCAKCHNEKGFRTLKTMEFFDHKLTDFPLEGKHVKVDCKKCHEDKTTKAIDFSRCSNCHKDYHEGEFKTDGVAADCNTCHSLNEGFEFSLFTIERHQDNKFKLEGAHVATACSDCHLKDKKWKFRNIGSTCTECHKNEHGTRFERNGVTDCERCHVSDTWFPSKFNHDETKFPLTGKHKEAECLACHFTKLEDGKVKVEYTIAKFECIDCHQ